MSARNGQHPGEEPMAWEQGIFIFWDEEVAEFPGIWPSRLGGPGAHLPGCGPHSPLVAHLQCHWFTQKLLTLFNWCTPLECTVKNVPAKGNKFFIITVIDISKCHSPHCFNFEKWGAHSDHLGPQEPLQKPVGFLQKASSRKRMKIPNSDLTWFSIDILQNHLKLSPTNVSEKKVVRGLVVRARGSGH